MENDKVQNWLESVTYSICAESPSSKGLNILTFSTQSISCGLNKETQYKVWKNLTERKSKHINSSRECYLLGQKHSLQIFGVTPIIRPQNDT